MLYLVEKKDVNIVVIDGLLFMDEHSCHTFGVSIFFVQNLVVKFI